MPTTEYNVSMILRRLPNESPEFIVTVIDEIQQIVYSQECLQTQKIEDTGMPPLLTTVEGVYEYDCPADCRRTAAIFTTSTPNVHNRERPVGPRREYYFRNKRYYLLAAETRDANPNSVAKIYFQEDPGSTTDKYYHLYYIQPPVVSDISIQLTLPAHTHYILREAVVSMLTSDEYGKSSFDEAIMRKAVKKIRTELNRGYSGNTGITPIRVEDQEYDGIGHRGY